MIDVSKSLDCTKKLYFIVNFNQVLFDRISLATIGVSRDIFQGGQAPVKLLLIILIYCFVKQYLVSKFNLNLKFLSVFIIIIKNQENGCLNLF